MSSTTTSTFSSPSPTDSGSGGGGGGSQRGANYFFGFLITFVGLLIIVIACGFGSRRRMAARREAGLNGTFEPWGRFSNSKLEVDGAPPKLYESPFVIGEDKWNSLMPLSVRIWTKEAKESDGLISHDSQPLTPAHLGTRYQIGFPSFSPPSWFSSKPEDSSLQNQINPDPPETIQVAVMIVMPSMVLNSPRASDQPNSPKRLPEYQIGNISLPWHDLHPNS